MALTQIRGEQIRDGSIKNSHVASNAAIDYSKLDLAGQIVASDLNNDSSVESQVLDSKFITLWDMVQGISSGTNSSVTVTTLVQSAAAVDTPQTGVTAKGVLLTGTGTNGAGVTNYRVQIRDATTQEPIADGTDSDASDAYNSASIYGELRNDGTDFILYFFTHDGNAFSFSTDTEIDILFLEVFSYLTAPAKGFIAGVGFADVVGISGSHNHNDLYYTQTQLTSGALDSRYYTETELNNGQLNNLYFTETELDPAAAATGDNVLDARYYRESEIASTASGSSGASLVGVAATGNLSSSTVQSALEELQGDIDDITSGSIDIEHSLDDAYNDGSVVTVDDTNVDFQVTDSKSFKVSDSTGVPIVEVNALVTGDTLVVEADTDITGTFNVTGASTLDAVTMAGTLSQSGGAVTLNAGANAVSVGGGSVAVDGSSVAIASTGALTLKDQYLTSVMPLSQTNAAALASVKFAYDAQTDFDWTGRAIGTTAPSSLIAAINTNREDLYEYVELMRTEGAALGTAAGANLIGVDGITGVIPTGGSVGDDSNLQAMLEGISLGAGGGKTYASISAFTTDKAAGTYFKLNEPVFILDVNRWIIVLTQSTNIVEGTDYDYVAGDNRIIGGTDYRISTSENARILSAAVDIVGQTSVASRTYTSLGNGASVSLDINSGVSIYSGTSGEDNPGQPSRKVVIQSDNGIELVADTTLSQSAPAITIDGQLTATGAADDNMIITTSGTGEVQILSADEIDLTGGAIDINAGTGYTVTIDSDTKITETSAVEVEINGGDVDINAGSGKYITLDSDTLVALSGGVEIDLTATTLDFNGAIDHDGVSFNSTVSGAFTVAATGDIDINGDTIDLNASGATIGLDTNGKILASSAAGQLVDIVSDTEVQINGGALVDIDGDVVTIDGATTVTAPVDTDITLTTSGEGDVVLHTEHVAYVEAPQTNVSGNVTIASSKWLNVDNIKITSVNPSDHATITGARSGTLSTSNVLLNPGFEAGSGTSADSWTYISATRTDEEKYYNSYSTNVSVLDLAADTNILAQAMTGLTASTAYTVSMYVKGVAGGALSVELAGGAAKQIVAANTWSDWTRVSVTLDADNQVSGNFYVIAEGSGTEDYELFIDAIMVELGSSATDYFSDQQSKLILTIGDDDNDAIIFRSAGTATNDLVRINQDTVEILGDLVVSGTTTTVNSEEMLVADNQIILNSGVTAAPSLDAFLTVERGTSNDVSIKWNESTDVWELTNNGTDYYAIVTSGGGTSAISMDSAYDGGSSVTIDDTNVDFALASGKSFIISDSSTSNANKFSVSAGSGTSSIKIDTSGGIDIDTDEGLRIDDNSGSWFEMQSGGSIAMYATTSGGSLALGQNGTATLSSNNNVCFIGSANYTANDSITINSYNGGIDINTEATKPITIDAGSFSIDGVLASNVSVTGADLDISTITSGDVNISAAATVDIDAVTSVTIDSPAINTTGALVQTGATQIIGAMNLDGNFDQSGNYTFLINSSATATDSVKINTAGGIDVDATGTFALNAANINTTGALVQTGTAQIIGAMNLDGSIDADGVDINLAASGTGGTHLQLSSADSASITAVGLTLEAGTGAFVIEGDSASSIDVTGANLTLSTTTSGNIVLNAAGGISLESGASGGFAITAPQGGGIVAATGNITFSTITSGDIVISSVGEVTFDDQYLTSAIPLSETGVTGLVGFTATSIVGALNEALASAEGANTLDEVYDGETGTRVVTMDNGSIDWQVTDDYEFNISDSVGSNIMSIQALSAGDKVEFTSIVDITGNLAQSTGTVVLNSNGIMDLDASGAFTVDAAGISLDSSAASNFTTSSGALTLSTTGAYDVNVSAGSAVVVSGASVDINATSAFTIDGAAASGITVTGANLTLSTATSGNVVISSIGGVDIDGVAITIDGTAASHLNVTANSLTLSTTTSGNVIVSSAGELTLKDSRTSAIPFSDSSNTTLPGGATSIIGALNKAYEGSIDIGYEEKTATSTDVTNDYVVFTITELPDSGFTFPASPSTLRSSGYYIAAYLNGLRLADTEWTYNYSGGEKQIVFDGTDDITLVSGDKVMVEVRKIV